jgi:hypothetical protein
LAAEVVVVVVAALAVQVILLLQVHYRPPAATVEFVTLPAAEVALAQEQLEPAAELVAAGVAHVTEPTVVQAAVLAAIQVMEVVVVGGSLLASVLVDPVVVVEVELVLGNTLQVAAGLEFLA